MCDCTSCKATDRLAGAGFDNWPKGEKATPKEATMIYTAHVNFNWRDARKRAELGPKGADFYGTPAGMTKSQVALVLAESFREPPE